MTRLLDGRKKNVPGGPGTRKGTAEDKLRIYRALS